jgi:hypothetical protein
MISERPDDEPFGMPSPEALKTATDLIRRRYLLPDTMQHPQVRSECMRLAYLIQAYGLAATPSPGEDLWSPLVQQASPASSLVQRGVLGGSSRSGPQRTRQRMGRKSLRRLMISWPERVPEPTHSSPIGG